MYQLRITKFSICLRHKLSQKFEKEIFLMPASYFHVHPFLANLSSTVN